MTPLSEKEITSQFIDCVINAEALKRCANRNGTGTNPVVYIVYSCRFLYDRELLELFGVTDKLKDLWERRGTDFNVCIHLREDKIVYCGIDKLNEGDGARPSGGRDLKCTQQELRIARRILDYITG